MISTVFHSDYGVLKPQKETEDSVTITCNLCGADETVLLFKNMDRLHKFPGVFNIVKCVNCGLIYINPRPINIADYYPSDYDPHTVSSNDFYSRLYTNLQLSYYKRSKSLLDNVKTLFCKILYHPIPDEFKGKVLDIGCGSGYYLMTMRRCGWKVYGIDVSEQAVNFARIQFGLHNVRLGPLEQQRYPDAFFDAITLNHVIEHLPDPNATVKEIFRILRPGGIVAITTPNVDSINRRLFRTCWFPLETPRHLTLFSPKTLKALLNKNGFTLIKIQHDLSTYSMAKSLRLMFSINLNIFSKLLLPYTIVTSLLGISDIFTSFFVKGQCHKGL